MAFGKNDLVDFVADATGYQKTAVAEVIDATMKAIQSIVLDRGETISLQKFGKFAPKLYKGRVINSGLLGKDVAFKDVIILSFKAAEASKRRDLDKKPKKKKKKK